MSSTALFFVSFVLAQADVSAPPVITAPTTLATTYNGSATFTGATAISVSDADAGTDGIQVRLSVTNGTLTLGGTDGLELTNGDGTDDTLIVFTGAQADIVAALAGTIFAPTLNFHGDATVSIIANDLGHTGSGGAQEATSTITIDVGGGDSDEDGLSDNDEMSHGTNPADDDTDDDGILDGNEDVNHNGLVDAGETHPNNPDTDEDSLLDGLEIGLAAPQGADTDLTKFVADQDVDSHTDPRNIDTDGGGKIDGLEDANHNGAFDNGETDPNDADDDVVHHQPNGDGDSDGLDAGGSGCAATPATPFLLLVALALRRRRAPR